MNRHARSPRRKGNDSPEERRNHRRSRTGSETGRERRSEKPASKKGATKKKGATIRFPRDAAFTVIPPMQSSLYVGSNPCVPESLSELTLELAPPSKIGGRF